MSGPLDGLRVLDLGTRIAAPFCAGLLGEMGADVVKIEQPGRGDFMREIGPFAPDTHVGNAQPYSLFWAVEGRGRRSVTLDLRIADESRYVEAALYLVTANARPYSHHDWHWRLLVAHRFGHAASAPTVHGTLRLLDEAGIEGELAVREMRSGRAEVVQMWGRPESAREEFRRLRAQ